MIGMWLWGFTCGIGVTVAVYFAGQLYATWREDQWWKDRRE